MLGARSRAAGVPDSASLLTLARTFTEGGQRRTPVLNPNGDVVNVVSQTALLRFIAASDEVLLPAASLSDMGLGNINVECTKTDTPVVQALQTMHRSRVSALPVLDETGEVVSLLSSSDLRVIMGGDFNFLNCSVEEFVGHVRRSDRPKTPFPYIRISPDNSVKHCITL
eukprot:TRINITY_DN4439_c0_g1_i1.p1 TRINITY_DN4439_c0_g1~~TRINITY_DN4439_c0_g1_i1.p1  ORF type:complete len:169 (+),score=40.09 TRINITY_DN4439_c0_g1_i1:1-507(+)